MIKSEFVCSDNIEYLRSVADNTFHSIVTDPPYELGFMGKQWDNTGIAYSVELWKECLRVLKPGGHLLSFGGSRTYHRMTCAIEDAGFEIRDQIMWIYGQGFPKSKNLSEDWEGWGSALKPAHEPICMARKPFSGTIQANALQYGTGAININACRIKYQTTEDLKSATFGRGTDILGGNYVGATHGNGKTNIEGNPNGRWPANVLHDGSAQVIMQFPDAKGQQGDLNETGKGKVSKGIFGAFAATHPHKARIEQDKSAARFFYCAKPSTKERDEGLDHFESKAGGMISNTSGQHITRREADYKPALRKNTHPTVKPIALMRYLTRLVTPINGKVLDPFSGSGTTGIACALEGFNFTGIDSDPHYVEIAKARYDHFNRTAA